jgi:hypothetical protein
MTTPELTNNLLRTIKESIPFAENHVNEDWRGVAISPEDKTDQIVTKVAFDTEVHSALKQLIESLMEKG